LTDRPGSAILKESKAIQAMKDYKPEVRSLIKSLRQAGFTPLSVNNGEENVRFSSVSKTEFLEEIVATDEATLRLQHNNKKVAIWLVLGNEPGTIAADYTDYEPLEQVIDSHYDCWESRKQPTC
jgi:hypothetical protein